MEVTKSSNRYYLVELLKEVASIFKTVLVDGKR
jgi:hypothetical protein